MWKRLRAMISAAALSTGILITLPGTAAAVIGNYTLPFYNYHTITQHYGHPPEICSCEPSGHTYAHWHNGIDFSMGTGTNIAASYSGTAAGKKESVADNDSDANGMGNYLFVYHGGSRWSLYYHLAHNGVLVETGDGVSAGEHVAESGNTGNSTGPHLHYALHPAMDFSNETDLDPNQWTTSSARIPFDAQFYSDSVGSANVPANSPDWTPGTEYIQQWQTITHWVKFKNIGGRSWNNTNDITGHGRINLYSSNSAGDTPATSPFEASDWETSTRATPVDQYAVPPDSIGTFTFGLVGNGVVGLHDAHNYFQIDAYFLYWFDWDPNWTYDFPIEIIAHCPGC